MNALSSACRPEMDVPVATHLPFPMTNLAVPGLPLLLPFLENLACLLEGWTSAFDDAQLHDPLRWCTG